jgi:hypothetical protein
MLFQRCLQKNPKRRWQAVGDLRAELEVVAAAPHVTRIPSPKSLPVWKRALPWILASSAAPSLGLVGYRHWTEELQVLRLAVLFPGLPEYWVLPLDAYRRKHRRRDRQDGTAFAIIPRSATAVYFDGTVAWRGKPEAIRRK